MDSDQAIEARLGCSIREFFEREGEDRFRDIEQEVIAQLCAQAPGVLATGGGVILRMANRDALRAAGTVVYLQSQPEDLMRRLRHDRKRPLLQVADPTARLRDLFAQRDPLYRETAHYTVETGRPSVSSLVQSILSQLQITPPRRLN
jgi:shikimate kinase